MLSLLTAFPLLASAADAQGSGAAFKLLFDVAQLVGEPAEASFTLEVHPEWAPLGAQRLQELVEAKFFDDVRFFRVIPDFMAQFGIHGDPAVMGAWTGKKIQDDAARPGVSNTRGRVSFATSGPNTRTTQLFINFKDNSFLDSMGFTPVAEVVGGMDVVDRIFQVGEGSPEGPGPGQGQIQARGNAYLIESFPQLSYVKSCSMAVGEESSEAATQPPSSEAATQPPKVVAQRVIRGLKLSVLEAGDGTTFPQAGDQLTMHYTLTLAGDETGAVIDSSRSGNEPFTFRIGRGEVIRGWDIGIMKMCLGQRAVLTVPSALGYGAQGTGSIPPNADLEFDVEVLGIGDHYWAAEGLPPSSDPLGTGTIAIVFFVSLGVLFFVACRGVGKPWRSSRPGQAESKDSV